jgi:hypothetical protein
MYSLSKKNSLKEVFDEDKTGHINVSINVVLKILREAFTKAMNDEGLLAEARKKKWDLDPLGGEELEALAREIMVQPPEVIERVKKVLGN